MKKLGLVLTVMVALAGVAYASSLAIPWFVDNALPGAGWPPAAKNTTLIYLKNNTDDVLVAEITYYSAEGVNLGPEYPANTFAIDPKASVAFRPVVADPNGTLPGGTLLGLEGPAGIAIPDRPVDVDTKQNGSAVVSWTGGPTDVQGMLATTSMALSYAHLLPPGT